MDLDKLIAIDVHVHAEHSCRQPLDPIQAEFEAAASSYFRTGDKRPDLIAKSIVPDLLFQSHSAPLGLVFYDGTQFPPDYQGDAFVSLHGSWNAGVPTGYKVVRVRFRNGRPVGGFGNFVTGFRLGATSPARVCGRPVGLALAKDGGLLIADDVGETVWRVVWIGR